MFHFKVAALWLLAVFGVAGEPERGYIELFRDDAYSSSKKRFFVGDDIPDLRKEHWDDAADHVHDKVSSYRFVVPDGWELQLCKDVNYGKVIQPLRGRGEVAKLYDQNDTYSSLRWVRIPEQKN